MIKEIKPGMWVLRESIMVDRIYSHPSEVMKVSGKRIYMRRPHRNKDGVIEDYTEKHGSIDLVKAVFDTEEQAWRIYNMDALLTTKFHDEVKRLRAEMQSSKAFEFKLIRDSF